MASVPRTRRFRRGVIFGRSRRSVASGLVVHRERLEARAHALSCRAMRDSVKLLIPAALIALFGCSDATGHIQGGEQLFSAPDVDGGALDDASGTIAPSFCQEGGTNTGNGWKDLYACYFGPMGVVPGGCGSPGSQG